MKKGLFIVLILFLLVVAGCNQQVIKDNQIYVVEKESNESNGEKLNDQLNTEGRIPFQEYEGYDALEDDESGRVLLTLSPDGKSMYFMEPLQEKKKIQIIKGDPKEEVRLFKVNTKTREQKTIIEGIPFVSLVKWNKEGSIVAFCGGGRLTIYDTQKNKLILEDRLKDDPVLYFSWSPRDENKLYTEQPNLANGSIYYIDSQKKVEAYETKERIYFKGKLDTDYYYGTKWYVVSERQNKSEGKSDGINTVIVDKQANVVKVLAEGSFRDSYKKSLVQVGEGGFGLYYIADINTPEKIKTLTKEYVFDVKFVDDGKIAYIVENEDIEKNSFWLYIVDKRGKELEKLEVSGSSIALLPNGKKGYIGGPRWEKIDFEKNQIEANLVNNTRVFEEEPEKEEIFKTIRGAMDTIYKYELVGERDFSAAKKYFIDTNSPAQWAYFDVITKFNETSFRKNSNKIYRLTIELKSYKLHEKGERASVKIRVGAENFSGGSLTMDYALELIKLEENWYVTGLSTFPYSQLREELQQRVEKYLQDAQNGQIFQGILKDKVVEIGQIQFWRSSMPHLSPDVESANFCKVYLIVKTDGKEEIYKMVLDKKNPNYWEVTKLSQKDLNHL
ncbi:MAG: hypothetical protein JG764_30 [Clostridiales bacterium]|jgi:hypothetical protein|nr:hypothetical protein [Clostridiales bacterium]